MEFQSHGTFVLSLSGNCIIATLSGAFNKPGAEELIDSFKALAEDSIDFTRDWGSIMDMMDFEMHIPEAAESILESYKWSRIRGQRYRAYVVKSAFHKTLLTNLFEIEEEALKNLKVKPMDRKLCNTLSEAVSWMKENGT